jgi:hypothetical protein
LSTSWSAACEPEWDIAELEILMNFVRMRGSFKISPATVRENHPHDIAITQEAGPITAPTTLHLASDSQPAAVLRWKTRNNSNANSLTAPRAAATAAAGEAGSWQSSIDTQAVFDNGARSAGFEENPLRDSHVEHSVQLAHYQQESASDRFQGGAIQLPELEPRSPQFGNGPYQDSLALPDPLDAPEPAPQPQQGAMGEAPSRPNAQQEDLRANPFLEDEVERRFNGQESLDLPDRAEIAGDISCNELRDRIRARPLTDVSLDVSPIFGEGMGSVRGGAEAGRLEFAASSQIRTWMNFQGQVIATGRLIDLRNDQVVLDVDGQERTISLNRLSDEDIAYVGQAWNIPLRCGIGNEAYAGRNFIPAAFQWKAPGHCHKPLYFEQVQLERYGHDAGPVMQPLISTAHFFANIAVIPYKMGIHPPHECQYSLGYFRPGNCAPYMLQPIPLSLRGAAVQAGVVTGAAALIP